MKCFKAIVLPTVLIAGSVLSSASAEAQEKFSFELVPYAWMAGIDADVTVGNRSADVDLDFDDLFDAVDIGGSFLSVTRYGRWVLWTQLDYFDLDSDNLDDAPDLARVQSESLFLTAAIGRNFRTFGDHSSIDVLVGARYLNIENELSIAQGGSVSRERDLTDGVFMIRPNFVLNEWLSFNPTMSVGAGDSDLTYELQPQLQAMLTDTMVARVGYRKLFYDISGNRAEFDGTFEGFILGLGFVL